MYLLYAVYYTTTRTIPIKDDIDDTILGYYDWYILLQVKGQKYSKWSLL